MNFFKRALLVCLIVVAFFAVVMLLLRDNIMSALMPYLPLDDGKSESYYQDLYNIFITEILWIGITASVALAIWSSKAFSGMIERLDQWMLIHSSKFSVIVIFAFAAITSIIAVFTLRQFPNSSDEYVYLYQAETLSDGHLWYPASPDEEAFRFHHIVEKEGIRVGRFPPGWPLLMAIFLFAGIPGALVNVILGMLALFVFYKLSLKLHGAQVANWGLLTLAVSGFYVFNSASFFSHTSCLFEALIFVYCIYLFLDRRQAVFAIMAGAALGLMLITRYYTAFLIAAPYCFYLLFRYRLATISLFTWLALGATPFFVYFLWYNYSITGKALEPVTVWADNGEGLGFIKGHNLLKASEHIIRRTLMFFYWVSPVFLVLYVVFLYRKIKTKAERWTKIEDYFFVLLTLGYIFYYEIGGNQYGPRFYFEAFPFLVLFVIYIAIKNNVEWAKALIYASIIVMILRTPLIAHRENKIINERNDLYDQVTKAEISNAVVIVANGTSVLRPMPSGDLTRNDKYYRADVLYALDHPEGNKALLKKFSDRTFYRYERLPEQTEGTLILMCE